LTTPTFCMNAYTLAGPAKRYPCDFKAPEALSDAVLDFLDRADAE